ncbi:MAG: hypothetical protein J6B77_05635, partial [Clostridia bacterium]|nr:hypothetical protein [Clostridia bacterium]
MLTYVINTSENKTFDSDKLFDLAGYNKIRWLNCRLSDIGQCAQYIHEKQNVLGADRFRIAVLVDFFGFDRLRIPYGRRGFGSDDGVDISLYIPYIEVFLLDNLIAYLEKREMYTEDFEVYYVQNTRMEPYEFLDNAPEQLCTILKGCPNEKLEATSCCSECRDTVPEDDPLVAPRKYPPTIPPCERIPYRAFDLYCTECVSLRFYLTDYPYGAQAMTFWEFYNAFRHRLGNKRGIRRHYYISSYGGGNARAAFDTLSLSLYLIRMYEREELIEDGEMEVLHLDADTLKEVLETAWGKINLARKVAKANDSRYFSLKQNMGVV